MILKHNYYYFKKAVPIKTCKKIDFIFNISTPCSVK